MRDFDNKMIHLFAAIIVVFAFLLTVGAVSASRAEELKAKIAEQREGIGKIEEEISKYQKAIDETYKEANTMKSQLRRLNANSNKLISKIKLTEKNIEISTLNIDRLSLQVKEKENDIAGKRMLLAEIIKNMHNSEQTTLIELLLSEDDFSDFFGDLRSLNDYQDEINVNLETLRGLKKSLNGKLNSEEAEISNYESLKSELVDQNKLVLINKKNKNELLKATKNKESNYKRILSEKKKVRDEFEKELRAYEAQLRIEIDPNSLPSVGSGVLSWPLDKIFITQKFGYTDPKRKLYTTGFHKGVDFRASIGTRVLSTAGGVVLGAGDTDKTCPGASFGKWVLIDHENGLAATYAHLSLIKVSAGQRVKRGQVIGYSGNTGYSTGPHLHLGVYARQGVNVQSRPSKACNGRIYTLPIAPLNAYLNPFDYL